MINWQPSENEENFLREVGIVFEKQSITLAQIDLAASRRNEARPSESKLHHVISGLKADMQAGYPIPFVEFYATPTGFRLADGVQRTYAIEELIAEKEIPPDEPIAGYLLKGDPAQLDYAMWYANCRHGGRNPEEDKFQLAIRAVKKYGESVERAARMAGVSQTGVRQRLVAEEEHLRLVRANMRSVAEKLNSTQLAELRKLRDDESAANKLAEMGATYSLPAAAMGQIAARAKKATSDASRKEILAEEATRLRTAHAKTNGAPKKQVVSPRAPSRGYRDRFFSLVGPVIQFCDSGRGGYRFENLEDFGMSLDDVASATRQVRELAAICNRLLKGKK